MPTDRTRDRANHPTLRLVAMRPARSIFRAAWRGLRPMRSLIAGLDALVPRNAYDFSRRIANRVNAFIASRQPPHGLHSWWSRGPLGQALDFLRPLHRKSQVDRPGRPLSMANAAGQAEPQGQQNPSEWLVSAQPFEPVGLPSEWLGDPFATAVGAQRSGQEPNRSMLADAHGDLSRGIAHVVQSAAEIQGAGQSAARSIKVPSSTTARVFKATPALRFPDSRGSSWRATDKTNASTHDAISEGATESIESASALPALGAEPEVRRGFLQESGQDSGSAHPLPAQSPLVGGPAIDRIRANARPRWPFALIHKGQAHAHVARQVHAGTSGQAGATRAIFNPAGSQRLFLASAFSILVGNLPRRISATAPQSVAERHGPAGGARPASQFPRQGDHTDLEMRSPVQLDVSAGAGIRPTVLPSPLQQDVTSRSTPALELNQHESSPRMATTLARGQLAAAHRVGFASWGLDASHVQQWPVVGLLHRMIARPRAEHPTSAGRTLVADAPVSSATETSLGLPPAPTAHQMLLLSELPSLGAGTALPGSIRRPMEVLLNRELSAVRLHTASLVTALGAQALTTGHQMVFAPGHMDFQSAQGLALLAHELSHLQQPLAFKMTSGAAASDDQEERTAQEREQEIERLIEHGWPRAPSRELRRAASSIAAITATGGASDGAEPAGEDRAISTAGEAAPIVEGAGGAGDGRESSLASRQGMSSGADTAQAGATNVDEMARQVYAILKRKLCAERERYRLYG